MTGLPTDDLPDLCPNCGAAVTGQGGFCASCGEPLRDTPTRPMRPVPAPPPRPPAARRPAPPPPPYAGSDRSVLAIFAVGLALILVLVGVALYVGGVFSSSNTPNTVVAGASSQTAAPASTNTSSGTTPTYTAPSSSEHGTSTFTGQVFTIEYPSGWRVKNNEKQESWGTDTTIVSPANASTYLRVDLTPNVKASDARASAQPVIAQLEKAPGYHLLDLSPEKLNGTEALHWEFQVEDAGTTLHKEDVFLISSNGNGVAVLTQAPDSEYESLSSQFRALRQSFSTMGT
jgi:hypothetical protein